MVANGEQPFACLPGEGGLKGETMEDYIMFADGFLEETEKEFIYRFDERKMSSSSALEGLQTDLSKHKNGYACIDAYIDEYKMATLVYQKPDDKVIPLATYKKKKKKNNFLKEIALTACKSIAEQYQEKGYFVLPVPENFLVDANNELKFIYQANQQMPRTGFGFSQIEEHTKRLLLYILSDIPFDILISQKIIETTDDFLMQIAKANSFDDLIILLETNISDSQPMLKEKRQLEKVSVPRHKESFSKPLKYSFKLLGVVLSAVVITFAIAFFVFSKPSVNEYKDKINQQEIKITELQKENEKLAKEKASYKKEIDKNEKEMNNTIEQLKAALAQNKSLKEFIEKQGGKL
ncbi:TPA: coiled-coil domain-containing protein [Listeria monocytogenes]